MSLAFPINPTDGQIYPDPAIANLPQFQWNNTSKTWVKLDTSLATETKAGTAEIATQAEVNTGTDDSRIVTPAKLKSNLDSQLIIVNNNIANLSSQLVPATETKAGIAEIATQSEVDAGTDNTRIVTPAKLKSNLDTRLATVNNNIANLNSQLVPASETVAGTAEIATQAEVNTGTDDSRIVTPAKLKSNLDTRLVTATETVAGIAEIATQAEVNTGTNDSRIVTPAKLKSNLDSQLTVVNNNIANLSSQLVPATETVAGIAEIATQSEVNTGTDNTRIVTPAKLKSNLDTRLVTATETVAGIAEIATQAEVTTGTDNTRMITPLKLKTNLDTRLDHVPMITHGGTTFPATRPDGTSNQPGDLWWNLDPDIVGYPEGLYVFAQSSTLGPNPGPATSWKRVNA